MNLKTQLDSKISVCDDILFIGCLFHDIGKGKENHSEMGSAIVKELLKNECLDYEIDEIVNIVRLHTYRIKKNNYDEHIKIIQDADLLDHFGTMEIWMTFARFAYKEKTVLDLINFLFL